MLKKSEPALLIKVEQSLSLLVFLVLLHAISAVVVFMMALGVWFKMALWSFLIISSLVYWRRYQGCDYCFTLKYSENLFWQLIANEQKPLDLTVLKSTVVTPFLVVLHVKIASEQGYFMIFQDAVDDDSFRKLRVFLKIKPQDETFL